MATASMTEWLPRKYQQEDSRVNRITSKTGKASDRFMRLPVTMDKSEEQAKKSRPFLRIYNLVCDRLPGGLVNDFAHIPGNDVMKYLLCSVPEFTPSRN
ncbi:hypothetical protein RRF57_009657 [Xylaria bambusicola]|uniref:Uncharacterized protein n=1 Tax=Xylaria bambusicola TaxID=326684 RepID=A0AAN7UQY4_9PEZI